MSDDLTDYERGYLDGLLSHAMLRDGEVYVGSVGVTYRQAAEKFLRETGHEGWTVSTNLDREALPSSSKGVS